MWRYFRKKIDQMGFWDWGMLKTYAFSGGLVLGAYFHEFVKEYVIFFIVLIVISFLWMMNSMFLKKH